MNYYEILGVAQNATTKQVAAAYRKLAVQYHPDKNPSPEAAAKFKEITKAYENLFDTNKRAYYDRIMPQSKPQKPQKGVKKRPPTAEELKATDPNLGRIWDAPPPKFDIWGKPLSAAEQAEWNTPGPIYYRKNDKPKPKPKIIQAPEKFIDVFERHYMKDDPPSLRGN